MHLGWQSELSLRGFAVRSRASNPLMMVINYGFKGKISFELITDAACERAEKTFISLLFNSLQLPQ